jgi:hypothetical protein
MITEKFKYHPCSRIDKDGKRHYCLPDGSNVPSVTTILGHTKSKESTESLEQWRNSVGDFMANQITTEAANRGTRLHSYLEHYVINDDMKPCPTNPYAQPSWFMAAEVILNGLSNITEYWGVEVPLYYSGLYAGTTDCLGLWRNPNNGIIRPSIIDFKQSNKPKLREWIDDYFLQLAAYSLAHNHMHGTTIDSGVIMMAVNPEKLADGNFSKPQYLEFVVEGTEFKSWQDQWMNRVDMYYQLVKS